jgi:hypothetical protein
MHDEDGHGVVLDLRVGDEALDFAGALVDGDELVVAGGVVEAVGDGGGILGQAGEGKPSEEKPREEFHGDEFIKQDFLDFAKIDAMRFEDEPGSADLAGPDTPAMTPPRWKKFRMLAWLAAFAMSGCAVGGNPRAVAAMTTAQLQCEGRVNPLGVDLAQPHLSWQLQSERRGERQTAYEVLAASSPELLAQDAGDLWDSGEVKSDESLGVSYGGKALASAQRVFWKVRAWDQDGQVSAWSTVATWTMGVMNDADWSAHWIGAPANLTAATLVLRDEFVVRPGLRRAIVNVCGLGQYEMSLNGSKVSEDLLAPGWTKYDKTCLYDTYDVTAMLQTGRNAVGLLLGDGMYNVVRVRGRYTKFQGSFGPLKAIAQLRLEYDDGTVEVVGTGDAWRVGPGPITFSSIYGGEDYDARLEPQGWKQPGFDDAAWAPAAVMDGPGGKLRGLSCAAPPIRAFETLTPVKVTDLRPGVKVYDLGQNASVMPRITVSGAAGSVVRIIPAELLKADGSVDRGSAGGGLAYWQYTLAGGGKETWFPKFFYQGSRYWQVECTAAAGGDLPVVESLDGVVVHSASAPAGEFACSNDLFNRINTLIRWAQSSNLMSVITDCPHRERLGWLEQDYLNGPSLRYDFDLGPLVGKVLNDMADSQLESGLVPSIAPEYTKFTDRNMPAGQRNAFGDSPEWGSALIQCAWQQYEWTGDSECLERYYGPMQRYAAYLQSRVKDGLINYGLGDWYDIGPKRPGISQLTPLSLTATAIYYSDLTILQQTAQVLGNAADARQYAQQAADTRSAFNQALFHADTGQYATGSQTANAMPLALGLAEPEQAARVLSNLVADARARGLTSGDVGYAYLLRALAEGGRSDVIFDLNNQSDKPGYGYQLKMGATSLTEAWNADRRSSQNHFMLGQIMEWFYRGLAGIGSDAGAPAYKEIILKPAVVGDITWVSARYDSARGPVASAWKRAGRQFTWKVTIPANCSATVYVPAVDAAGVTEGGQPAGQSAGVQFLRMDGGAAVYKIGSGDYTFVSELAAA